MSISGVMNSVLGVVMLVLGLSVVASAAALSQGSSQDSVTAITTDTGAFAVGHTRFLRYDVLGLCRAAVVNATAVLRRTGAAQTQMDTIRATAPTRDTLPAAAVAIARQCGARFTVAGTAPEDLEDLFHLALLEQNDALASAVVHRRVALASTAAARDTVWLAALGAELAAEPARVAAADSLVAHLAKLGPEGIAVRVLAHDTLLAFYRSTYTVGLMRQEAERILALSHEGALDRIPEAASPVVDAYQALVAIAFVAQPDSLLAVAQRAKDELSRFPVWGFDWRTATVEDILKRLSPIGNMQQAVGQVPVPLMATYWFPHPLQPTGTGDRAVSLIVFGRGGVCLGGLLLSEECFGLSVAERLKVAQYAARGVAVTVAVQAWSNALGDLPAPTVVKADTLNWYFREHLRLPVTVAVIADSVVTFPLPDGRVFPCVSQSRDVCADTSRTARRYLDQAAPLVLMGRDGRLVYAGDFSPLFDAVIDRLVPPVRPGETESSSSPERP